MRPGVNRSARVRQRLAQNGQRVSGERMSGRQRPLGPPERGASAERGRRLFDMAKYFG